MYKTVTQSESRTTDTRPRMRAPRRPWEKIKDRRPGSKINYCYGC